MSYSLLISSLFALGTPLFATVATQENAVYTYPLKRAPAKIQVNGASTLGKWDCNQSSITGTAETNISADKLWQKISDLLEAQPVELNSENHGWKALQSQVMVAIDAYGFNCDNGRMQKDLAEAIKADKYPNINYWFSGVEDVSVLLDDEKRPYLELNVRGDLLFGGERRKTAHTSRIWLSDNSTIEIMGKLDLQMSDFGIKPPRAFFGLIQADNNFQVSYHIKLETNELVMAPAYSTGTYTSSCKAP